MNTNGLAKLYGRLTPLERLPLLVAAIARGDETEGNRLLLSAPRLTFTLPDYHGHSQTMIALSLWHLARLLDLAILYERARAMLDGMVLGAARELDESERAALELAERALSFLAHRIRAERDGWRQFCAGLNLDPDTALRFLPGYNALLELDVSVASASFTAEEAMAFAAFVRTLPPRGGRTAESLATLEVNTAEGVAAGWRLTFDQQTKEWQSLGCPG